MLQESRREMTIVVLAGGLGTRIQGILGDTPKAMAPIGDEPFLEYLLLRCKSQGFQEYIVSLGHEGGKIRDYFGDGGRFGLSLRYTVETTLLGTAGAVKLAEPLIDSGDFAVVNGDTYLETDLNAMLRFHKERNAIATMALVSREDTRRYGTVVLGSGDTLTSFAEKAAGMGPGYINGGTCIFRKEIFGLIPAGKVCSLEREVLPLLIGKGLYGFPADGYFIDIGIPEDYERAQKELPARRPL